MIEQLLRQRPAVARTLNIILLFLGTMLAYVDRQVIALLQPTLVAEFGWTASDYAHLGSVFSLTVACSVLFAGWLVDKFNVRIVYGIGIALWSLAGMAHALASTVSQFVLVRAVLAAGESVNGPATIVSAANFLRKQERSISLGVINMAPGVGAIIAPLAIPLVAVSLGWHAAFILTGALGFLWLAVWLPCTRAMSAIQAEQNTVVTNPANATGDLPESNKTVTPFWTVIRYRSTWAIAGAKAIADMVWWFMLFWIPDLFGRVFGLTQGEIGAPIAVAYAMAAAGALSSGFVYALFMRWGLTVNAARKMALIIYALLIFPVPLALTVESHWWATVLIGLALFAHNGFVTNIFSLTAEAVPLGRVGKVTAFGMVLGNLTGVVMLEFAGWSISNDYGYTPLFVVASVAYLISVLWLHLWLPKIQSVN